MKRCASFLSCVLLAASSLADPSPAYLVKDIAAGTGSAVNGVSKATASNGRAFLFVSTPETGWEPWTSDGTTSGTQLVKVIDPSLGSSTNQRELSTLADLGGMLYFRINDGTHGSELWKSDGTEAGTVLVKDVWPGGFTQSDPSDLTAVGSVVVFSANDGVSGRELWVSDGTAEGTRLVADIAPMGSSNPHTFKRVGPLLFFRATTNATGEELYAVPVAVLTDADLDGLLDADERALGSDPFVADSDGDGLGDGDEVHSYGTNPLAADTDGDGWSDSAEIQAGTNPLDPQSFPSIPIAGPWLYGVLAAGVLATARRRLRGFASAS